MRDKNKGLYEKYSVIRTDGTSEQGKKHDGCKYFVIDLDHDEFAADTIRNYAELCKSEYPVLSKDLIEMSNQIKISKTSLFND